MFGEIKMYIRISPSQLLTFYLQ